MLISKLLLIALGLLLGLLEQGLGCRRSPAEPRAVPEQDQLGFTTSGQASHHCPHRTFQRKHECVHCANKEQALEKSRDRWDHDHSPTSKNTVLAGNPGGYYAYTSAKEKFKDKPAKVCRNREPITAWNCDKPRQNCRLETRYRFYDHSADTGHLYYRSGSYNFNELNQLGNI